MEKGKIKRFFIVYKEGLEKKWWHRLANVLIYGSIIILFLILLGNFIWIFIADYRYNNVAWKTYHYIYNFQSNYSRAKGTEKSCWVSSDDNFSVSLSESTFEENRCANDPKTFLTIYQQTTGKLNNADLSSYNSTTIMPVLGGVIKSGDLNNLKVKKELFILYNILAAHILIAIVFSLIVLLIWFVFWESIVYRAVVYIILGKK